MRIVTRGELRDMERETQTIKMQKGGMWEEHEWEIRLGCWVSEGGWTSEYDRTKCEHCTDEVVLRLSRKDGSHSDTIYTKCPRVVVARNEGGFNSTGVCLDCILKAEKAIKK